MIACLSWLYSFESKFWTRRGKSQLSLPAITICFLHVTPVTENMNTGFENVKWASVPKPCQLLTIYNPLNTLKSDNACTQHFNYNLFINKECTDLSMSSIYNVIILFLFL